MNETRSRNHQAPLLRWQKKHFCAFQITIKWQKRCGFFFFKYKTILITGRETRTRATNRSDIWENSYTRAWRGKKKRRREKQGGRETRAVFQGTREAPSSEPPSSPGRGRGQGIHWSSCDLEGFFPVCVEVTYRALTAPKRGVRKGSLCLLSSYIVHGSGTALTLNKTVASLKGTLNP